MKNVIKFYKKIGFVHGIIVTIITSSLVSFAATNLPGFNIFAPGTPISANQINDNFEKVAGLMVMSARLKTSLNLTPSADFTLSDSIICGMNPCGHFKLDLISQIGTLVVSSSTDSDSPSVSSTNGSTYHYFQVPTSG